MKRSRLILIALLAAAVVGFFYLDLGGVLELEALKARQAQLQAQVAARPLAAAAIYFSLYVLVTGLSLPGAALMTVAGGAVFGLLWGTLLASFASTLGASLAFLMARFLLREPVAARFGARLAAVDAGIARDGAFYLFGLRLVPLFPFFVINLLMGLTALRLPTFWWVSQLGMLPGTLVYVNAGRELARIDSLGDILSPGLLLAFALLGLFPLLARRLLATAAARRALRPWPRPRRFDRNLIVIGAGSGGLVTAYLAAAAKAKVTLIEKDRMGGDCLNTGCVPSKTLLRSARLLAEMRRAPELGIREAHAEFDFAEVMERVRAVIRRIEPHDSVERYEGLGVEVLQGEARVVSPWEVEVAGRRLSARAIVIAAGARPRVPPLPGLAEAGYLTTETVWELRTRPRRLLVLGGGPVGCELSQAFARLGCQVKLVQRGERLLPREDPEAAELVQEALRADGVSVYLGHEALSVQREHGETRLRCRHAGGELELAGDALLLALGRVANVEGYGLEELGVRLAANGNLDVDGFLSTSVPTIFACGDVAGPFQYTHAAAHQAGYAAVNALLSPLMRFRADYRVLPTACFTEPELARVGLSEAEARRRGLAYELTRYDLSELDRAITEGSARGFVKVLTPPGRDRILGVSIAGPQAAELIAQFALAMKHGLGLAKILGTVHAYPTLSEANKYAAGAWRRAHSPGRLLAWAERFHAWRRG